MHPKTIRKILKSFSKVNKIKIKKRGNYQELHIKTSDVKYKYLEIEKGLYREI